jgi:CxxC-x17-CxxC domain-containing protein
MTYQDKKLTCKECGVEFDFTASEQAFYEEKGFQNEPSRCPECRAARKARNNGRQSGGFHQREMYTVTCSNCGAEAQVPFKPTEGKPVYCRDCFQNIKKY